MRKPYEASRKPERVQDTITAEKPKEQLSDRELAELMGINRDTFTRRRGAVRKR